MATKTGFHNVWTYHACEKGLRVINSIETIIKRWTKYIQAKKSRHQVNILSKPAVRFVLMSTVLFHPIAFKIRLCNTVEKECDWMEKKDGTQDHKTCFKLKNQLKTLWSTPLIHILES